MKTSFSSHIDRYIKLKQSLGRRFSVERRVLKHLDDFLRVADATDLTKVEFESWCKVQVHVSSGVRRNRMRIVRNFCLYRRRTKPDCFVPDDHVFPAPHQVVQPHIFSELEIARLLQATANVPSSPRFVLRSLALRLSIILLYTTGLRRGELVRLVLSDYDQRERTLLIRDSKFHKSRCLPLSEDASTELDAYLTARRKLLLPMLLDSPLLWSGGASERGFSASALTQNMHMQLMYESQMVGCLVYTIIAIHSQLQLYYDGTALARIFRPNFPCWQRIWGTYQSPQRSTICLSYQILHLPPAIDFAASTAHSCSHYVRGEHHDGAELCKHASTFLTRVLQ
jgi:integrase/recombinase XerD